MLILKRYSSPWLEDKNCYVWIGIDGFINDFAPHIYKHAGFPLGFCFIIIIKNFLYISKIF